jgi:hypothetical protein
LLARRTAFRQGIGSGEHGAVTKLLIQYRVFIASPSGLDQERKRFREKLDKFTALHAEPLGVIFHPVGWEETVGGVGRPQRLINEDLEECDYAVFILHDRWGSPSGSGSYTSGVEEEWDATERLYQEHKIRNVALFFKEVAQRQIRDPGEQLKAVLAFKNKIEQEKKYLFNQYSTLDQFVDVF